MSTSGTTSNVVIPAEYLTAAREKLSVEQRIALARNNQLFLEPGAGLADTEREVLRRILLIVAQDVEVRVRQALAETLADKSGAPHEVVLALANDDDLVAAPILRFSEVLKPEDLVAIIESQKRHAKMSAIAERRGVPPSVCMALINHGDDKIADRLLQNPGADISDIGLNAIVDRYGKSASVQKELINRDALPATVIEKVVSLASAEFITRLIDRHLLPESVGTKLALEMRERAVLGFTFGLTSEGMSALVDQLISENRLTPGLILRSLAVGNMELIIHAIALRCQLGIEYVRDRLVRTEPESVQKMWQAAEMPASYLPLALVAISVLVEARNAQWTAAQCRAQIAERFFAQNPGVEKMLGADDVKFLRAA